jgi:hypothetical protein
MILKMCLRKARTPENLKNNLEQMIRITTKNTQNIGQILINNKNTNRTYECVEHEDWKNGKHFQKRLKDMPSTIGKIGQLNAKTVPRPEKTTEYENTLESIASYLNITNIVHNGIYRNGKTRCKNSLGVNEIKRGYIPVFCELGKLIINIQKYTFTHLLTSYMDQNNIHTMNQTENERLNRRLCDLVTKTRTNSNTGKWKMNAKVNRLIIQEFEIKAERCTNPFSRDPSVQKYYPQW